MFFLSLVFFIRDYSDTKLIRILNSELADTLGNLLSRCCGSALNPRQTFPRIEEDALRKVAELDVTKKLIEDVRGLPGELLLFARRFFLCRRDGTLTNPRDVVPVYLLVY